MFILSITRYDINHGEIAIFLPIKAPTKLSCEKLYFETIKEDKEFLLKDFDDIEYTEDNFEYNYRIDEIEDLLTIRKRANDDYS
jgi:hypothetical protein